MKRRTFISGLVTSGAAGLLSGFWQRAELLAADSKSLNAFGYGNLTPKAAANTGEVCLALPAGFEYKIIGRAGSALSDGLPVPAAHDGMGAFSHRGKVRLVRNHEINHKIGKSGVAIGEKNHYDESAGGGTTTLVIDPVTREIERSFVSLSGTLNNCAGGATPWGSWISCEETTLGRSTVVLPDDRQAGGFLKPHGYCFEVPASANSAVKANPLTSMGRFVHEAVAFDAKRGVVYLTEDNNPAGLYRFLPRKNKRLADGGTLQILSILNQPNYDLRKNINPGSAFPASWVTIPDPDPIEADTNSLAVYRQGERLGAAIFTRLEGCFTNEKGEIYFTSTDGGKTGGGQIWLYQPNSREDGTLTLVFESSDRTILDMPDNICLAPRSELVFVCEDSDYAAAGGTSDNFIRIMTPTGKIADFARNILPGYESSEFAGAVFSPDGKTLFVNLQTAGITLEIWGDWKGFRE